jgi:hypothetical protein
LRGEEEKRSTLKRLFFSFGGEIERGKKRKIS